MSAKLREGFITVAGIALECRDPLRDEFVISGLQVERLKIMETSIQQRVDYLESQMRDLKRALRDGLLHTVRWVEKNSE